MPVTETLLLLVCAFVVIAAAAVYGPKLGVASPLVLVAVGVGASFLPVFDGFHVDPDLILDGVLPPLLYASAVSMPATNFRREFGAISGLSVLLVIGTSLLLGLFFMFVLPGLGFAWGVALGAVLSPTDAVATSIVKGSTVSQRVVAMLDGESLLNDASALVLLRTAIVATAASFSFLAALGTFAYSVAVAVVVGGLVGWLNVRLRRRVTDPAVNTVISFAVPFVASVPSSLLHASGLVAAVVAGLVTGIRAPRRLSPRNRLSDNENWRTVALVLEGAVFLVMGLQIKGIVTRVQAEHAGVGAAVLVALGALAVTVAVRAAFVAPLLGWLALRSRGRVRRQGRFATMQEKLATPEGKQETLQEFQARGRRRLSERDLDRFSTRLRRWLASVDYFVRQPLGWREGTAVVWAGMRGAVTVAAAQTLPDDAPQRSVLVLVAFAVAASSLLVQGGTVGPLLRLISPPVDRAAADAAFDAERDRLLTLLRRASEGIPEPPRTAGDTPSRGDFDRSRTHRLAVLAAQRDALLDARDDGAFDADVLEAALANIDADEIAIDLRQSLAARS